MPVRLELSYATTYAYEPGIRRGLTALRIRPRSRPGLIVERSRLAVSEGRAVRSYVDGWGTQTDLVEALTPHDEARWTVEATIETVPEDVIADPSPLEIAMYRSDSSRVRLDAVAGLVAQLALDPHSWSSVEMAVQFFPQWFNYRIGATSAETTIEDAVNRAEGVCQDFSHVLIAVLRAWGWPARYASGYVYTGSRDGGRIEAEAMHAWAQVYRADLGWVGLDPTTGGFADDTYVPVGFGRDYDDVRPVRGVVTGPPSRQRHSAALAITLLESRLLESRPLEGGQQ